MKNKYIRMDWRWLMLSALLLAVAVPTLAQSAPGISLTESTSLSPFIGASYTYDSNVLLLGEGRKEYDFYLDLVGGLSLLRKKDASTLNIRGWHQFRRYQEYEWLDDETWQVNGKYVVGYIDRVQLSLMAKYGVLSDYEFTQSDLAPPSESSRAGDFLMETRTMRYPRTLESYSAGVARKTRHFDFGLLGCYSSVAFDTSQATLYDWSEIYIQPRIGYRVSEKTSLTLSGELGEQDSGNDLSSLEFLRVRLGTHWIPSEKTQLDVGAGHQQHSSKTSAADGSSLDKKRFHIDGNLSWMASSKILLHVSVKNEYLPAEDYQRNTKRVDQASVGGTYELTQQLLMSLGLSYRRDDYTAPIQDVDGIGELAGIQARLAFASRKQNLRIYLKGSYEEFTSNIQTDYNQLRMSLGLNFAF